MANCKIENRVMHTTISKEVTRKAGSVYITETIQYDKPSGYSLVNVFIRGSSVEYFKPYVDRVFDTYFTVQLRNDHTTELTRTLNFTLLFAK